MIEEITKIYIRLIKSVKCLITASFVLINNNQTLKCSVASLSKLSVLFFTCISSDLPSSPYICTKTLASVPAFNLSPVLMVISYGITENQMKRSPKELSEFMGDSL